VPDFTSDEDYAIRFDLPRPRWDRITPRAAAEADPATRHQTWCQVQREWLRRLRDALQCLQQAYQIAESESFMILTAARGDVAWLSDYAEQANGQIITLLGDRPVKDVGKRVVLILAGEAEYRRYLRHYSPDGKLAMSAGVWIKDGDAHIAIDGLVGFKSVLVHELVHAHLASGPRPRWLEEGLAQHVERRLVTRQRLAPGTTVRQELRSHWRPRTLNGFWSGEAFRDARLHGSRPYAYQLAALLVSELASLSEPDLCRFALAARRDDAGAAASREVYGFGLEVWAGKVLGGGEWAPAA
jgi:hypothetical protein